MRKHKRDIKWTDRATPATLREAANKTTSHLEEAPPTSIKGWKTGRHSLAKTLVASTLTQSTPPRIAEATGTADQDTASYQLRKINMETCEALNEVLGREAAKLACEGRHVLAIDTTDVPYWGSRDA